MQLWQHNSGSGGNVKCWILIQYQYWYLEIFGNKYIFQVQWTWIHFFFMHTPRYVVAPAKESYWMCITYVHYKHTCFDWSAVSLVSIWWVSSPPQICHGLLTEPCLSIVWPQHGLILLWWQFQHYGMTMWGYLILNQTTGASGSVFSIQNDTGCPYSQVAIFLITTTWFNLVEMLGIDPGMSCTRKVVVCYWNTTSTQYPDQKIHSYKQLFGVIWL